MRTLAAHSFYIHCLPQASTSDSRWLSHERCVRAIYRELPALIVTLQQPYETSGDAEAYGIGALLATYTGVASIVFLSEVLDILARMNVSM